MLLLLLNRTQGGCPEKDCKEAEKGTVCELMARASRRAIAFLREVGNHTPCVESVRERVRKLVSYTVPTVEICGGGYCFAKAKRAQGRGAPLCVNARTGSIFLNGAQPRTQKGGKIAYFAAWVSMITKRPLLFCCGDREEGGCEAGKRRKEAEKSTGREWTAHRQGG